MRKKTKDICTTVQIFSCYNNHYNPHRGTETSTSLYQLIQSRHLTDSLELLERLGFAEERAIHVITGLQILRGAA